jgi:hypothetical protein
MQTRRNRVSAQLDRPMATLLIVLGLYLAYFGARLAMRAGDISLFVWAGDRYTDPLAVAPHLSVLTDSNGYDGQFYYRLAVEPFTSAHTDHGVSFDSNPAYRQQRILYPLLAHALALGRPQLVPTALVVVNLIAAAALGWFAGALAKAWGQHALTGLLAALYPGLILTFDLDLAEILGAALVVGTLWLLTRKRHVLATLSLCLAVLAKETTIGLAVAAFPAYLWARLLTSRRAPRWHLWLVPGALYVLWQAWLRYNWGTASLSDGTVTGNVTVTSVRSRAPAIWRALVVHVPQMDLIAIELLALLIFVLLVFLALWRSQETLHVKLAFLSYVGLAAIITHYLGGDWAFMRALTELWMIGSAILLATRHRGVGWLALAAALSWGAMAVVMLLYR